MDCPDAREGKEGHGSLYCDFGMRHFSFRFQLHARGPVLSEINCSTKGAIGKECVQVGYIGIDDGDNSDDASATQ